MEGAEVNTSGNKLTWAAGAAAAKAGMFVRVVRPSGKYDDYSATGYFGDPKLTAKDKGLEIHEPVAEAKVVSAGGGVVTTDTALTLQAGDVVYLGDASPAAIDGQASTAVAGVSGYAFAKVLLDATGGRHVPHYRAIDIASDNRIPPGKSAATTHGFTVPQSCTEVTVKAVVMYRPLPLRQAALRGWDAKDYVIATATKTIKTP